jgi:hypothetical protein
MKIFRNPEFNSGSIHRFRIKFGIAIALAGILVSVLPINQAQAATLFISPSSGTFSVGSSITVSVRTNTQSAAVNTAEANILYSTDTLELLSVSQGPTFYLPAPGSPNKGIGTAYFGGGLPTPGFNGASGILGSMTFRARAEGTATVSVSSGSVLLNDGAGTNALDGTASARFSIVPPPVGLPIVTSTTHPNSDGWYTAKDVDLSWNRPAGAFGFSFELDKNPDTIPDNELDTTVTTIKKYESLEDGIWYFHIKARGQAASAGFGNTSHFRIGIDNEKPFLFDITMVGQDDLNDVTRTPTITFEAKDELSGIGRYDVYMDSELIEENVISPYTFSKLEGGPHVIRVIAFDKAGNDRKAELPIISSVPAGFLQKTLTLPIYMILIINLLILILLVVIIWLMFRRKKSKGSTEVAVIQNEIDQALEELKQKINSQLLTLVAKSSTTSLKDESKVAAQVSKGISKARQKIDKKISKLSKKLPEKEF